MSHKFYRSVKKVNILECSKNLSSTRCLDVSSVKSLLSFLLFLLINLSISLPKCTISSTSHSFKSSNSCCFSIYRNSAQNLSSIIKNLSQVPMHRASKKFSSVFLIVLFQSTSKSLVAKSINGFFHMFNPAGQRP